MAAPSLSGRFWRVGQTARDDMTATMSSLADLEARVAALEADRADYRAVLAAVGAFGQRVDGLTTEVGGLTTKVDGLTTRVDPLGAFENISIYALPDAIAPPDRPSARR
jgi:outer membrane murein-binding lipoprotein Lpp